MRSAECSDANDVVAAGGRLSTVAPAASLENTYGPLWPNSRRLSRFSMYSVERMYETMSAVRATRYLIELNSRVRASSLVQ